MPFGRDQKLPPHLGEAGTAVFAVEEVDEAGMIQSRCLICTITSNLSFFAGARCELDYKLVPPELPLPQWALSVGIKPPADVTIERRRAPDAGEHGVTAATTQHQRFDRRLPFRQFGLLLRQLRDVVSCVLQRDQLPAVGQNTEPFMRPD